MLPLIPYLYFIVLGFIRRHKIEAIHPYPLLLCNDHYIESFLYRGRYYPLQPGFYEAALDNDQKYVIGVILDGNLLPLTTFTTDPDNTYERYKLRIHGDHAFEIVKILKQDPLNTLFFEQFKSRNIRSARVLRTQRINHST